jgi:hypothetical protein
MIITGFPVDIQEYNDTKGQAYGQTENIDQGIQFIPNQDPESNLKKTGKHHQIFLIKRICPMNITNIHAIEHIHLKFKRISLNLYPATCYRECPLSLQVVYGNG